MDQLNILGCVVEVYRQLAIDVIREEDHDQMSNLGFHREHGAQ
jgi:hypothetical protein